MKISGNKPREKITDWIRIVGLLLIAVTFYVRIKLHECRLFKKKRKAQTLD